MQHSKKSSCWSKLHLGQRQVGRNLVVVGYILCSHFRVKMTSWGFPGPTHTGHNWGHNPGVTLQSLVTLQSGCSLQSGVSLQSRATLQSRGTLQSVSLRGHIWITDIFNLGFFFIKYMQHGLFVFARRRIVTFQTSADYFLTMYFPLLLKGIVRDTPMIYQRL